MKKIASMVTSLLILMGTPALAGTSAQVEYGTVQESRILTQEATPQQGGARPLRTIGAAALGAAVGSQFGGGSGQTVATTVGAVAGAEVSRRRQGNQQSGQGRQTVELLIKTEAGKLLNVVQEQDPALTFAKGDRVRILTTGADTRVDKSV
ncbi:glycine zipper 2TM domain-containing protein [Aeromonas caviae]|uniref:glycine zipper 2TM domain-containing protein n=1 Tax=Aeromonas caviae TaxID=648 RepID=UPI0021D1224D|nr:glycine zipper 2TM domain-containing protein [Aeromonas caviae]MCU7794660.1 glycine zipper 2TM domain-containing protein [Aeromonas caviae]WAF61509.1 glycine zipper 2TM domain-containing protein [Aeromonas caviae]WAF65571.1 glycine zipper 2TM domain-containing protein [Aeromonas caviae]WAF82397.1 glycine zipper 2TM domain-containing protein [Aeromonas caviae]